MATPSLLVAGELSTRPDVDVLVPGGRIRGGDLACTGSRAVEVFSGLYADTAFLGSGRIDGSAGLTDFHFEEIATKREILTRSALCYVLADGSKQGRVAPHRVCVRRVHRADHRHGTRSLPGLRRRAVGGRRDHP